MKLEITRRPCYPARMRVRWFCCVVLVSLLALPLGAGVETADTDGRTPLMLAAANQADPAVISLLLRSGADPAARTPSGRTALMFAALGNVPEVVSVLLQAGSDPNQQTTQGMSPILYAAMSNGAAVLAVLHQAGAKLDQRTATGMDAMLLAAAFNPDPEVLRWLIAHGASPADRDSQGRSALMYAAARNHQGIVKLLLEAGADPRDRDRKGKSAYDHAQGALGVYNAKLVGTPAFWQLYRQQY